jgi:hypothetical protein
LPEFEFELSVSFASSLIYIAPHQEVEKNSISGYIAALIVVFVGGCFFYGWAIWMEKDRWNYPDWPGSSSDSDDFSDESEKKVTEYVVEQDYHLTLSQETGIDGEPVPKKKRRRKKRRKKKDVVPAVEVRDVVDLQQMAGIDEKKVGEERKQVDEYEGMKMDNAGKEEKKVNDEEKKKEVNDEEKKKEVNEEEQKEKGKGEKKLKDKEKSKKKKKQKKHKLHTNKTKKVIFEDDVFEEDKELEEFKEEEDVGGDNEFLESEASNPRLTCAMAHTESDAKPRNESRRSFGKFSEHEEEEGELSSAGVDDFEIWGGSRVGRLYNNR